jgi:2-oxoglutarate ferredoxin oxidoreductase subunit beta
MTKLRDLITPHAPTWCPGCGNFGLWGAFKQAAVAASWDNTNSVMVAGIGCHGHIVDFTKITSFEGLHGRALPVAEGIKIANNRLNVFVFTGDGDCLGEGGNHFIHACRRNHDLTVILHDNEVYALTTGQTSPASPLGFKSKSTPKGSTDRPFSVLTLAIASGATFVARGFAGDIPGLTKLIIAANDHHGFAVVDVLQPCVSFNNVCTHQFYQENTYWLNQDYDPTNKEVALKKSWEWDKKKIPLGVIYQEERPTYESLIQQISEKPLVEGQLDHNNLKELFSKYT